MELVQLKNDRGVVITCTPEKAERMRLHGYFEMGDGREWDEPQPPKRRGRPPKKTTS